MMDGSMGLTASPFCGFRHLRRIGAIHVLVALLPSSTPFEIDINYLSRAFAPWPTTNLPYQFQRKILFYYQPQESSAPQKNVSLPLGIEPRPPASCKVHYCRTN